MSRKTWTRWMRRTPEEIELGFYPDFIYLRCFAYVFFPGILVTAGIAEILEWLGFPEECSIVVLYVGLICISLITRKMGSKRREKALNKKRAAFQAAKRLEEILQPAIAHVDTKVPSDIMQHCERLRGDNEALERELRRYRAEGRIDDTDAIMLIRVYASRRKKNKESSERLAAVFGGTYGIEEY